MKPIVKAFVLFLVIFVTNSTANSQTYDLVAYFRFDNPPQTAFFQGQESDGTPYVQEYRYNMNVPFQGASTLRIDEYTGSFTPDTLELVSYFTFTDTHFFLHATELEIEDVPVGLVRVTPLQPAQFNRFLSLSQQTQISSSATTDPNLGPVTVTQSYTALSIETVEVPYGLFEDCLLVQRDSTLSASIGTLTLSERFWAHPTIGVVRWQSLTDGFTEELVSITPDPVSSTPTPTVTPSPTSTPEIPGIPTPTPTVSSGVSPIIYEFGQDSLQANGWSPIPGGFQGQAPGQESFVQLPQNSIPSSADQVGLSISVQAQQVSLVYANQAIDTDGKPVLLRAVVRSSDPNATFALVALRGNLSTNENVDGSIASHIPFSGNGFLSEEKTIVLLYQPDSGELVTPAIQVSGHASLNGEATVWIDRLEIYVMNREESYSGELFYAN